MDDRRQAQMQEEARRQQREVRREQRRQMEQIARDQGLNLMEIDDLETALRGRGLWPLAKATTLETMEIEEEAVEEDAQENTSAPVTGSTVAQERWLDATAVAAFLDISRPTAKNWMEGDWNGPYRIVGCRNFEVRRGNRTIKVRKAPLKAVDEVKNLLDQARHSRNGSAPQKLLPMVVQE
jgi:hypothetical protein